MLAAIAEEELPLHSLGSDLLLFSNSTQSLGCTPSLQPSPSCVIATDEAFQASLAASVMQAPLASWDIHFHSTPVSNEWIPEILLCLPCSPLAFWWCVFSFTSTATLSISRHPPGPVCLCRSEHCLVPRGCSATQALSTVLLWLYPQFPLLLQASGLSQHCDAYGCWQLVCQLTLGSRFHYSLVSCWAGVLSLGGLLQEHGISK